MGQVLAEILHTADELGDGSRIDRAVIERDQVVVTVRTAAGDLPVFVLRQPGAQGGSDGLTRFALDGPPGAARAALAARLAGGESRFAWTAIEAQLPAEATSTLGSRLHELAVAIGPFVDAEALARTDSLLQGVDPAAVSAEEAWTVARVLLAQKRLQMARKWLQRAVDATQALDPRQAAAGALGARLGALDAFGQIPQADSDFAACTGSGRIAGACGARDRSEAAQLRGDFAAAIRWFEMAMAGQTQWTLGDLQQRAALAMRAGDAPDELKWAQRASKNFPQEPDALELLAAASFRSGQFETAVRTYEALYHLAPQRVSVLAHLSGAFNRMHGEAATPEARQAYQKLRQEFAERASDPRDGVARFLQAVATFYDGDFVEAIGQFAPLLTLLPAEPRVPIYLAMGHYWTGNLPEARRFAAMAVEKGPRDPDVYYCRSKVWQDERREQAIADLEQYVRLAEAPGAIAFADKTARIRQEIDYLRRGRRPPDWDRPGFAGRPPLWPWLAAIAGVGLLAGWWRWRRRAR